MDRNELAQELRTQIDDLKIKRIRIETLSKQIPADADPQEKMAYHEDLRNARLSIIDSINYLDRLKNALHE